MAKKQKQTIGHWEWVSLPDWGIGPIKAKVDTGAASSALHVKNIKRLADNQVQFTVVGGKDTTSHVTLTAPVSRITTVKSSNGQKEDRYFVKTTLQLGNLNKVVEISLAKRQGMRFRMLLGRKTLAGDVLIDPAKKNLLAK